ncbi:MAG: FAD-dependent oxidoreductase [Candidatus Thermoplasmatota archaeon]|nr:FAD-dependent oxidoreductase [Candidatus Thermoplasmatota archaeon]
MFNGFPGDVPYERFVVRETVGIMDDKRCASFTFSDHSSEPSAADSFVARRSRFDKWLSEKAEEAGAVLVTSARVDDLYMSDGRVRGIVSAGDRIEARCVIDAEGVTASLSRKAGVRSDVTPGQFKIGVKETVEIGRERIDDIFALRDDEGLASVYIGYPSRYLPAGGAFIYTNRESVSIGVVLDPVEVSGKRVEVQELVEEFRLHPHIQRLIGRGKVIEYSAHMIPNSVPSNPQNLAGSGFMVAGDAAGFFINNGYTYRGVDLAIASGYCAAETFVEASKEGSFDAQSLRSYAQRLEEIGLLPDMRRFEGNQKVLHNSRIFSEYPGLVLDMISGLFAVKGFGKGKLSDTVKSTVYSRTSKFRLFRDIYSLYRNM